MKCAKDTDELTLKANDDADTLGLVFQNGSESARGRGFFLVRFGVGELGSRVDVQGRMGWNEMGKDGTSVSRSRRSDGRRSVGGFESCLEM